LSLKKINISTKSEMLQSHPSQQISVLVKIVLQLLVYL